MNRDKLYEKYYRQYPEKQLTKKMRVQLRPLTEDVLSFYLDDLIEYSSSSEFYNYLEFSPVVNREDIVLYYKNKLATVSNENDMFWLIILKITNKAIGTIRLTELDLNREISTVGYGISPYYSGKGYFTESLDCLIKYAINELGFYRVQALTRSDNIASRKGLERVGFLYEGLLRQYQLDFMNNRHDVVIYSLLKGDIK
jgi:[ribosomal protein S5]-alanine N-acetyltransferase